MTVSVSLPDSLRNFLEEEMRERGHESLDACVTFLLERARRAKAPCRTIEVGGQTYRIRRLSDSQCRDFWRSSIAIEEDYYPPDAAEFSREEINRFTAYFVGFLEGCFESLSTWWKDRFLLIVESNLILYGYDGEAFFTRRFDSAEEFERTRATLAERLPAPGFYARHED
jgi:hypothetical protein